MVKTASTPTIYCSPTELYVNTDYSIYTGSNLNVDLL